MEKIEVVRHVDPFGKVRKAFKIPLKIGFVYMGIEARYFDKSTNTDPEEIVIVDRERFLSLWKNQPYSLGSHAFGSEETWKNDRKFNNACLGFSSGIVNPVPLAFVHCYMTKVNQRRKATFIERLKKKDWETITIPYCAFSNGITRTIFLLAYCVECFPVMTDKKSYELLKSKAGIKNTDQIVQNIFNDFEKGLN